MSVKNGKAFEYACLRSIHESLSPTQAVSIVTSPQLETAHKYYLESSDIMRGKFVMAANAATRVIIRLEPQLEYPVNNIPLYLSI